MHSQQLKNLIMMLLQLLYFMKSLNLQVTQELMEIHAPLLIIFLTVILYGPLVLQLDGLIT